VHAALVEAGAKHGMRLVGGRCYSSNALESAWIPSPLPAIYSGEAMRPYREWLTTNHYEARASIGGSYVPDHISGYYLTPWDLGYGPFVKFDHDFIGRAALEKLATRPHRKKVTLALDDVSVTDALYTMFDPGLRAKFIEFPSAVYSMHPFDLITADGRPVGLSTWIGYSANEGKMLTLAMVDEAHAAPGTEVTLLWGEPDGGTSKPAVERHKQVEIKAIVSPAPYSAVARTSYADSWRNRPR
jgi:glycine cleavage system aminomethyltransferase T